jgi:hypothetical protein
MTVGEFIAIFVGVAIGMVGVVFAVVLVWQHLRARLQARRGHNRD